MQREYKISLSQEFYSDVVYLSQYDSDYDVIFKVMNKHSAVDVNGKSAKFTGTRKDGLGFTFEAIGIGSYVSFEINTSLTAVAGHHTAEIVFYDSQGLYFGSANVQVVVEPAARKDGTIDADTERAQEIAEEIQEIVDNAAATVKGEAEAWAVGQRDGVDVPSTDPAYENNAKFYAEQAAQTAEEISGVTEQVATNTSDISSLKEDLSAIQTATSEDVGKALKAKAVADGKVTEWEFGDVGGGGEDYYTTTPSLNLCDDSEWTDTATTAPLIPVEYGKTYSTNLSAYGFSTYCYDANKTSLGANNSYSGVVVTKGNYYDGVNFKYTVEVVKEAVAYIQYRIAKPADIVPMFFEGDVDIPVIPIAFDDTSLSPVEPALGDLKSVMLSNHKVARAELDADLSNAIKVLGYSDKVVQASNIYNFDASTSELLVYDGIIQGKDGVTAYSNAEFLFFDASVNRIKYDFRNGTSALSPWVIVKDNFDSAGRILSLSASGMSYIYALNTNDTVAAADNSFAWTAENPLVSVDIVRNSDNIVLTFVDSTDTEIVKTYTFAQLGITGDPGRMGMYPRRSTATIRNKALACVNLRISAKSSISGGGSSASRLKDKTWDAWGDSFTAGASSYPSKVATATGCTATNLGQSGDKVATVLGRFNSRADACGSYVTVFAGVNDFLYATAMATFRTNVQDMITAVIAKAPSSRFAWIIPPQTAYQQTNSINLTLEDYDDAIIEICRANSVPVLDLYHEGGWYTNSAFTSIYIGGDGLHPSAQGQALLADKIQMFLERL